MENHTNHNAILQKSFKWYNLFLKLPNDIINYIFEFMDASLHEIIKNIVIQTRVLLLRLRLKNYKSIPFLQNYIEKCLDNFRLTKSFNFKINSPITILKKMMVTLVLGECLNSERGVIEKPKYMITNIKNYVSNCLHNSSETDKPKNNLTYNDYNYDYDYNDNDYLKNKYKMSKNEYKMSKNEYKKSKYHTLSPKKDRQKYRKHISKLEYRVMKKARLRKDAQRLPSYNEWEKVESYDITYLDYDTNRYNYCYFLDHEEYIKFNYYIKNTYIEEVSNRRNNLNMYKQILESYQYTHIILDNFYENCTFIELYNSHPELNCYYNKNLDYMCKRPVRLRTFLNSYQPDFINDIYRYLIGLN